MVPRARGRVRQRLEASSKPALGQFGPRQLGEAPSPEQPRSSWTTGTDRWGPRGLPAGPCYDLFFGRGISRGGPACVTLAGRPVGRSGKNVLVFSSRAGAEKNEIWSETARRSVDEVGQRSVSAGAACEEASRSARRKPPTIGDRRPRPATSRPRRLPPSGDPSGGVPPKDRARSGWAVEPHRRLSLIISIASSAPMRPGLAVPKARGAPASPSAWRNLPTLGSARAFASA